MPTPSSTPLRLFHIQTSTLIQIPENLTIIRIGKPNPNWSPDIDISNLPNSEMASSSHAEIQIQGNAYFIEDLGSTNGTFLNHSRLTPFTPYQLHLGDRIDLGKDELLTFLFQKAKRTSVAVSRSRFRNDRQTSDPNPTVSMSAHQSTSQSNQQKTWDFNILGLIFSNLKSIFNSIISFFRQLIRGRIGRGTRVGVLLIALFAISWFVALLLQDLTPSVHLTLGNPSNATSNPNNPNNYLMEKPQYALSYNNSQGIPNWVSWQLNQSWLGSVERSNDFRPDTALPSGWYQVRPNDYIGSGYDRGHIVPSGDRTRTPDDNSATFVMTNIIPQAPQNNREVWRELEEYSRELVYQGKELYIIAGGAGSKGTLQGKVTVPQQTWKVIAVLDLPGQGVRGITSNTRLIAVMIPNSDEVAGMDWRDYRVSVDMVEAATGYNFLSNVSTSIQDEIESRLDKE
ncbi:MAG: DNA/RNA non-specific endonuclease [Coleofasciculus sp. G2-EDA-02]